MFASLMDPLGPFEHNPHLAVAVSGGADSMALALLAHAWVRHGGGTMTALTVDHGLRPEAAGEARQVGVWLTDRGIAHETLVWRGPPSGHAINLEDPDLFNCTVSDFLTAVEAGKSSLV